MSPTDRTADRGELDRIRAAAESIVGHVSDEQWQDMIDVGLVDLQAPYSETEVAAVAELIQRRFELWGSKPRPRRIPSRQTDEVQSAYDDALRWFGARKVPLPVAKFREIVLHGTLTEPVNATSWLAGLLRATAEERGLGQRYATLASPAPDTLALMAADHRILEIRDPIDGLDYWAPVQRNTDEDWLRSVSENLADDIGWTMAETTLWVITDVQPTKETIRTVFHPAPRYNPFGERIEMVIDLSATPKDVAKAYGDARAELVHRRPRSQSAKHLRLTRFMDERPGDEPWEMSMHRWNDTFPDWAYSLVSTFGRDARAALRRFVGDRPFASQPGERA